MTEEVSKIIIFVMFALTGRQRETLELLLELAGREGREATVAGLAAARGIPETSARQVVAELARRGVVRTRRGAGGGLRLAHPPESVTVLRALGLARTAAGGETTAAGWVEARARRALERALGGITLQDLCIREREAEAPEYVI